MKKNNKNFFESITPEMIGKKVLIVFVGGEERVGTILDYEPHRPQLWMDFDGERELILGGVLRIKPFQGVEPVQGPKEYKTGVN